ncbi:MAG: ABC transporter substrate-binding protein [Deltaproteobacteria bacterium]|nr:ABC transporter substrate-binding protein [Deltaproteobacteria bacterium]
MKRRERPVLARPMTYRPAALILSVLIVVTGCEREEEPVKVGFAGVLTGRLSDLGRSGRNGVILAVEEVNRRGGINGRPVELIVKDDKQDPEEALRADRELIDEGVVAIIGHVTSAMSMAAVPLMNKEKVLMISPTTSTDRLKGIDDYFVRVMPPNRAETDNLAHHGFNKMGLKRLSAVYDLSNRAYTEGYFNNFREEFEGLGGKVIHTETFTSGKDVDFSRLAELLLKPGPDGILVAAGAIDTAMICQRLRVGGSKVSIISSGWAMTSDLLHEGGPAVEGVVFSQLFDRQSRHRRYLEFKKRFEERFGEPPDFAAAHGYEAASALFKALSENPDPGKLKDTLLKQDLFEGVQGDFKIDKYGDPQRPRFLITVKNGRFLAEKRTP